MLLELQYYTFTRTKTKLGYSFKGHLFYMQTGKISYLTDLTIGIVALISQKIMNLKKLKGEDIMKLSSL